MIQPPADFLPSMRPQGQAEGWRDPGLAAEIAFVSVWATGSDPRRDGIFRLAASRRVREGWLSWERRCDPVPGEAAQGGRHGAEAPEASARMVREFGVDRETLRGASGAPDSFCELLEWLEGTACIVADRATWERWYERHGQGRPRPRVVLDLGELAALFAPGRLAAEGERLCARLLPFDEELQRHPRARLPHHLHGALTRLLRRLFERKESALAVTILGLRESWQALGDEDPEAARRLELALALAEHPSAWGDLPVDGEPGLFAPQERLGDGRPSDVLRAYDRLDDALEAALPSWARLANVEKRLETLPAVSDGGEVLRLDPDDRARVDDIFRDQLARLFAGEASGAGGGRGFAFRAGQAQVAAELAERFGEREMHLMHAPTGTGKTLAYLVPTLLWAFRNAVRVGVATYTRALQEQAMDRDVPLALRALREAGVTGEIRVSSLKGRQNYLCWRALKLQTPMTSRPDAQELLAWTTLATFGLDDPDGDLDRFSRPCPLPGTQLEEGWSAAVARLVRLSHAETGCCSHREDRDACGAEAARRRAERSHVVVTNHAFALARREFFRHLVFDECEHLHDVAHNAFSHTATVRGLRDLLARLYRPGSSRRHPLNRIAGVAVSGTGAWECVIQCVEAWEVAQEALVRLGETIGDYKLWRDEAAEVRGPNDLHSLFREYVELDEAEEMVATHARLTSAWNDLTAGLAQLSEHMDSLPTRGMRRVRRSMDVLRSELDDGQVALEAWIPRTDEGHPYFRPETFHDLETNARGEDVLAARVLLPHEYLGRHYYPDLLGAVLISATTWLRNGFAASSVYLGLQRAAEPLETEERVPSVLRCFRAPEAFDYGRVLVAVPRDAPDVRQGKRAWLKYVSRFLGYLAERSRGRVLALFTNADDVATVGRDVTPFFGSRELPCYFQGMHDTTKEELAERFRNQTDATLLGVDTFWYGADFPGETLEYLVIVRLPYGVPDRYHQAQCAALGSAEQRRQIYMPRALSKFRQGFGRLMRKETDRGVVFLLDQRILEPRHRSFLKELPLDNPFEKERASADEPGARLVQGDTNHCFHEAFAHMGMLADIKRRELDRNFRGWRLESAPRRDYPQPREPERPRVAEEDLPF